MDLTEKIADFVVGTTYEAIPLNVLEAAKTAIVDAIGVILAGSQEDAAKICGIVAREQAAKAESTVIGQGFKSSSLLAGLVNGTASHALDYDHSFGNRGQPTASLVPTVFTLGEALGASGREILTAYVLGFEVIAKLIEIMPGHSSQRGWHSTGTLGSIGSAVVSTRLFRLNEQQVQMALGIVSSMASGMVANYASMTKPLHAGLAAKNGILAARLALDGFSSGLSILERPKGFFDMFSRDLLMENPSLEKLGVQFDLVEKGIRIKPYPCGGLTHSSVDALLEMRVKHEITPKAIESIRVGVPQHAYQALAYHQPETGLQGKFSMPYILARALIHGKLKIEHFTDEAVWDVSARNLGEKISLEHDPEMDDTSGNRRPGRVTIRFKDGRTLSQHVDYPKGGRQVPLTLEEIRQKFFECAERIVANETAYRVLEYLERLETLSNLEPLCQYLIGVHNKIV
ncbi:MmgE/PrpD family protein [Thermodesulfobacteriota bacterium]